MKIITRRANDRSQKATETEVEGGARTALVISASQCQLIELKCLAYMLITHTGTGLSLRSAKSPLPPPNPSIHSSGDTLALYLSTHHPQIPLLPFLISFLFSLVLFQFLFASFILSIFSFSFLPSFYVCPSISLCFIDEHSRRHAALRVEQDSKSFTSDAHTHLHTQ